MLYFHASFFLRVQTSRYFKKPFYVVRERIITSKILTDEDYAETVTQEFLILLLIPYKTV